MHPEELKNIPVVESAWVSSEYTHHLRLWESFQDTSAVKPLSFSMGGIPSMENVTLRRILEYYSGLSDRQVTTHLLEMAQSQLLPVMQRESKFDFLQTLAPRALHERVHHIVKGMEVPYLEATTTLVTTFLDKLVPFYSGQPESFIADDITNGFRSFVI